ncbi:Dual specificity tyrosine-phosphorylation-regulated kinase 4 [Symbiodinium microadriaticum]|uniref:Dual specificity tyrosine-phosphorylation-regulated kinase 4 n=1 Tax=Symbiodinium microadriaticum TaxID=2951 RepID=A0A1Q9DEW5_SYMMI|nr:Dual specificity tyrosine-phosphorylation-regulated kinase 4 [Symbiodinium microadriaticum]
MAPARIRDDALVAVATFLRSGPAPAPAGFTSALRALASAARRAADAADVAQAEGPAKEAAAQFTDCLLRRFADQALQKSPELQQALSARVANALRCSGTASTCSGGDVTPSESPPAGPTLDPSEHYAPRRSGTDVNFDPDLPEEYRDDLDPGYRIREIKEQELLLEIQDKYERALAAAPELLQWATDVLPNAAVQAAEDPTATSGEAAPGAEDDELLGGTPAVDGGPSASEASAGGSQMAPPHSFASAGSDHTLADAIMHGVQTSGHAEAAEASGVVPTFGANAEAQAAPAEAAEESGAGPQQTSTTPSAAPKALSCGGKIRPPDGRPKICHPESADSFYPVELDGVVYDSFNLRVVHERDRTGFEETKDFPIRLNSIVAGRYQVLEYLGSAAFSRAVQCLDLENNRIPNPGNPPTGAHPLADNIDDKNCLALVDYFYHKEHLIIVTELLRDNLYEFSKYNREACEEPYFTLGRLQRISKQILVALEYIHQLYLIHADLKPENILIKSYSRCEVKVIDFGSSCFVDDSLTNYVQSRSYRAPEVILGLAYDQKIDIWSLGCIVAELWAGFVLFQNDSVQSLLARIMGILGPLPAHMMATGRFVPQYFTQDGRLFRESQSPPPSSAATMPVDPHRSLHLLVPKRTSLKQRMRTNDEVFLDFLSSLLQVDPALRPSAAEALQSAWHVLSVSFFVQTKL